MNDDYWATRHPDPFGTKARERRDLATGEAIPDRNLRGPRRALSPSAIEEVRELHRRGWSAESLAAAFDVHKRTVYRYVADPAVHAQIVVTTPAGRAWRNTVRVYDDAPPVLAGDWEEVA